MWAGDRQRQLLSSRGSIQGKGRNGVVQGLVPALDNYHRWGRRVQREPGPVWAGQGFSMGFAGCGDGRGVGKRRVKAREGPLLARWVAASQSVGARAQAWALVWWWCEGGRRGSVRRASPLSINPLIHASTSSSHAHVDWKSPLRTACVGGGGVVARYLSVHVGLTGCRPPRAPPGAPESMVIDDHHSHEADSSIHKQNSFRGRRSKSSRAFHLVGPPRRQVLRYLVRPIPPSYSTRRFFCSYSRMS